MSAGDPATPALPAARVAEARDLFSDPEPLLAACRAAPLPEQALLETLEIVRARRRRSARRDPTLDPAWLARAARLAGSSRFAARLLRRHPRLVEWLQAREEAGWPDRTDRLRGRLHAAAGHREVQLRLLRHYRRRSLLEIADRDLAGTLRLGEVFQALSDQADTLIGAALELAHAGARRRWGELPGGDPAAATPGLAVLALGKLGGQELNYSSDVDLLAVYAQEGETSGGEEGAVPAFTFAAAVVEETKALLGETTEDGEALRVDLDLRPEGRSGPLANSLSSLEQYYATFGRTWERQAWIKARPAAGDLAVGRRALDTLQAFVYPRSLDRRALEAISAMKGELDREVRRRGHEASDLKLGRGGIRTIEFIVQALQLLHGGKDPALREPATLEAIRRLQFAGHLDGLQATELSEAYVLLRRVEHLLQLHENRQTHRLPVDPARLQGLARALGLHDPAADDPAAPLLARLDEHRESVQRFGDRRFGSSEESEESDRALAEAAATLLSLLEDREALTEACGRAGFDDPSTAAAHLGQLARRPLGPFGRAATPKLRGLARALLIEVLLAPDPDAALEYLTRFLTALPGPAAPGLLSLLAERPPLRALLLSVFGSSHHLARTLLNHPELLDEVLLRGRSPGPRRRSELEALWQERRPAPTEDDELHFAALRRFRGEEALRIGIQDVAGVITLPEVSRQLTELAELCLEACLDRACAWAEARWGWPVDAGGGAVGLSVVALGRLGSGEMGYGSDLDLVFLYHGRGQSPGGSREGVEAQELFARLAQRAISALTLPMAEGRLYAIDTQLRPSGSQGALVASLEAFQAYHRSEAQVWERQALTRARVVSHRPAPEPALAQALEQACYGGEPLEEEVLRGAIRQMRERQRQDRSKEASGRKDPRAGWGGLIDIEFIVQYLQLRHGADEPRLRTPATGQALAIASEAGLFPPMQGPRLLECWDFLRRLENRLRIVHDRPIHAFPTHGPKLDALARRMGYHQGEMSRIEESAGLSLLGEYERVTTDVRRIFEEVLGRENP
ncbi:MAG: bifunctional [glutamate--ammonia ligase]-adenylyl-L-tyrosine phosphorylase/[glutamate--ammonia-ligase] adenylyltransferase [Deltaproteobacteria bacterium]|nr:bifunctional [glutamate--ammonia ligase]-adenylyl-L-tyrosine phosphorylase/[glutamate--ammonia-ligase] adenylyltransferase [Deltaproteobacteria bacterium]